MTRYRTRLSGMCGATLLVLGIWVLGSAALAQEATPTPAQSKDDRIREHRERIRQIIQERREQQQATEGKETSAGPEAATPSAELSDKEQPGESKEPDQPPEGQPPGAPVIEPGGQVSPGAPPQSDTGEVMQVSNCLLYMKPLDSIATVGSRFATRVILDNPSRVSVDKISIVLKYDPRVMSCLRVFDDQIRPQTLAPPRFEDQPVEGRLQYEAVLRTSRVLPKTTVLTLLWEAIRPTQYSEIQFEFRDTGLTTAVTNHGEDTLGLSTDPYDGVINGSVLIHRQKPSMRTDMMSVDRTHLLDFLSGSEVPRGDVGITLVAPEKPVRVDETFDVPIFLRNPDALPIDMISIRIRFNPDDLEVVDWDKGNWIRRGINIYDGNRHALFPFDYLVRNEAMNSLGTVDYVMGCERARALPTGRLATIRFLARRPVPQTAIELVIAGDKGKRLTQVTVHGEPAPLAPGLTEARVTVRINP